MKLNGDGEPSIESGNDSKDPKMPVGDKDERCSRSLLPRLPVFNTPGLARSPGLIEWSECQTSDAEAHKVWQTL